MRTGEYQVIVPRIEGSVEQGDEWVLVEYRGERRRIRFHDYGSIYRIPGLYEQIFYHKLKCASPAVLTGMLHEELQRDHVSPSDLRVLDYGAGNGIVGEHLRQLGCRFLVGVDILPEAQEALERDRPGVYDRYYVLDMNGPEAQRLRSHNFNCLVTVAALGFDDIPTRAFLNTFNLIADGGWVVFNLRDRFLSPEDNTGYRDLITRMEQLGALRVHQRRRYCHRLALTGEELYYIGVVGRKAGSVPPGELA